MAGNRDVTAKQSVALLLLPEFTMMPVTAIVESLRLANYISQRDLYSWKLLSKDGAPVEASNGLRCGVDGGLTALPRDTTLIVCGGYDVERHADASIRSWIVDAAGALSQVGGICMGVHVLAQAGLLDGYTCALHWEALPSFRKSFPHIDVTGRYYDIDRDRFTCAGGVAAVDMCLAMIGMRHGHQLAAAIAESFISAPVRSRQERQPNSIPAILGTRHPQVLRIVRQMERTLDMPLRHSALAKRVGLSQRQMERLFRRYLGCSPKQYHQQLRLQQARHLLIKTGMSVTEVSVACGFSTPSYFSRCYSSFYDYPPSGENGVPRLKAA